MPRLELRSSRVLGNAELACSLASTLRSLVGVNTVLVDLTCGVAEVGYDPSITTPAAIRSAFERFLNPRSAPETVPALGTALRFTPLVARAARVLARWMR